MWIYKYALICYSSLFYHQQKTLTNIHRSLIFGRSSVQLPPPEELTRKANNKMRVPHWNLCHVDSPLPKVEISSLNHCSKETCEHSLHRVQSNRYILVSLEKANIDSLMSHSNAAQSPWVVPYSMPLKTSQYQFSQPFPISKHFEVDHEPMLFLKNVQLIKMYEFCE